MPDFASAHPRSCWRPPRRTARRGCPMVTCRTSGRPLSLRRYGSSRSVIGYAESDQGAKPILSYESHLQAGGYFWLGNGCRLGWQPSRRMQDGPSEQECINALAHGLQILLGAASDARTVAGTPAMLARSGWNYVDPLRHQWHHGLYAPGNPSTDNVDRTVGHLSVGLVMIRMDIDSCEPSAR
jgi:hypothetical protein